MSSQTIQIVRHLNENTLTSDVLKTILDSTDNAFVASLFVKLITMKMTSHVSPESVDNIVRMVKEEHFTRSFRSEDFVSQNCAELAAALLTISLDNKTAQEDYTKQHDEWFKNPDKLGVQEIRRNPHSCEEGTSFWNRSNSCREVFGTNWIDAGDSYNWTWCGISHVNWGCKKNDQRIAEENNVLRNKEPKPPVLQNLPNVNCLTCAQNISFLDNNTVDETSLAQAIECSIATDGLHVTPPSQPRSTSTPSSNSAGVSTSSTIMSFSSPYILYSILTIVIILLFSCSLVYALKTKSVES